MAGAGGRPKVPFDMEIAKEICEIIASSSKGIIKICRERKDFPGSDVVYRWLSENNEFYDLYIKAKQNQIEVLVDEVLEIADDTSKDTKETSNGEVCNSEYVNRARLKVDTRKWLAAKLVPRLYGERTENIQKVTISEMTQKAKENLDQYEQSA